jgi:lysyl-tRNA synthetase class 2
MDDHAHPRLRRPRAPLLLALLAAATGVAVLAAAAHPGWHDALALAARTMDPMGLEVTRGLLLAVGIGLLLIARGLSRGSRRALYAAMFLLAASFILLLVHNVELLQAAVCAVLLGAFWHWRWTFDGRGDPGGPRRAAAFCGVALTLLYVVGFAMTLMHAAIRGPATSVAAAAWRTLAALAGQTVAQPASDFAGDVSVTLATAAAAIVAASLWLALRAPRSGACQTAEERRLVYGLVAQSPPDSLAYFVLRRDKTYFFEKDRRAALAYRAAAGIVLVSGDPVGDRAAFDGLLKQFAALCRTKAWRIAVIGVAANMRPAWARIGLRSIYVGDEAVVVPERFSLEGRPIRKVRQSVHRLRRAGYRVRVAQASTLSEPEWQAVHEVSAAYRPHVPVQGFSMAADDLRAEEFKDALFALAEDTRGTLAGFLHFVPVPGSTALSLSAVRRRPETPNGFTEFLLCEAFAWGRANAVPSISLTFNAFGRLLRGEYEPRPRHRLARWGIHQLEHVAQVERLHDFYRKFMPDWQPRYFACESLADIPAALLLLLSLERLVYLPPVLQRAWVALLGRRRRSAAPEPQDEPAARHPSAPPRATLPHHTTPPSSGEARAPLARHE